MNGEPKTRLNIVSRTEFAQNLAESGLLDISVLQPDSAGEATDGAAAAQELVAAGKLTPYQADAILDRRFTDLRVGNYEILSRLGSGGMGTVYKARHRRMKRIVALKVLSREVAESERFLSRFQREIETIARLTHPNIVMAFDADEGESGPFLVMEFVDGQDLATEVITSGPLPVAAAVDRILQAARGLEYAHRHGVIHRDIKPGNILRDGSGMVKVADLGLARFRGADSGQASSLTQSGAVVGTVDYMPPEQAMDSATVDQRADIYSLGYTLYFLLTGHAPYSGGTLMALMLKHRDAPIPDIRALRLDVPPELEAIFRKMVAKRPEERYQSMTVLIKELEQLLSRTPLTSDVPIPPLPTSVAEQAAPTMDIGPIQTTGLRDDSGFVLNLGATNSPAPHGVAAGLTVIVAEPSRTQAGIIKNYLQQLGAANAHACGSGREAVEAVKRFAAKVVISSLHLADMTGIQLAATLRADPTCSNVGFVLATSETDATATAELPQDTRTAVMVKPFDLARLSQCIASVIA